MLHNAPGISKLTETNVFLVTNSNLLHKPQNLSKHMVLARDVVPPQSLANAEVDSVNGVTQNSNDSTVSAVCYKPTQPRENKMERRGEIQSSDSKHVKTYWRQQVS